MDDQDMHIESEGYALSGKIMLSAIIILFVVIIFMVGLHLYARWYLIRLRRHQLERRRQRRGGPAHIVIYADNHRPGTAVDRGLEPAVLSSLPVFFHSAEVEAEQPLLECAVCLSEFEEKEIVRLLPKCNHSFHIECIDMWFHSHSTCPLCRSPVEVVVNRVESEVVVTEPVELCTTYQECENGGTSTTLFGSVRKGLEVRIEIPTTRIHFENELTQSLPASRLLSRIISMGKKSPRGSGVATPCGAGTSRAAAELELESGLCESSRVATPR